MPFQKGHKRFGGRKKGLNNLHASVLEMLHSMGHNPIERMVAIAEDLANPLEIRAKMECELASYGWAKKKAVEHTGTNGSTMAVAHVKLEFVHNDHSEVSVSAPVPLPSGEV